MLKLEGYEMRKFRLNTGDHAEVLVTRNAKGIVTGELARLRTAPAIVESESDLCALFNRAGIRPKYEELHDGATTTGHVWDPKTETLDAFTARMRRGDTVAPAQQLVPEPALPSAPDRAHDAPPYLSQEDSARLTDAQLQVMTVGQLQAHCEAEEIPFDGGDAREKLVHLVRAFQGSP